MTAERDSMTLNEVSVPALEVEERSDEAPRAGRASPGVRAVTRGRDTEFAVNRPGGDQFRDSLM